MQRIAFIVDGGYFCKRYKVRYKKYPNANDVEKYITSIFKYIKKENSIQNLEIYRVFYYDCPPIEVDFLISKLENKQISTEDMERFSDYYKEQHNNMRNFHNNLKRKNYFALRMGILQFKGINEKYKKPILNQKGVDMRIGLDIADITSKKLCSKIVLISGDTDMIPAMKKARKEGIHVYLDIMNDAKYTLDLVTHSDVILKNKRFI